MREGEEFIIIIIIRNCSTKIYSKKRSIQAAAIFDQAFLVFS